MNTDNQGFAEQKFASTHVHGDHCQSKKTWTLVCELPEAQCGGFWEIKAQGGPHSLGYFYIFVNFTSRHLTRFLQWMSKKVSYILFTWAEKEPFWNMQENSVPYKFCPQKLFNHNLSKWGYLCLLPQVSGTISEFDVSCKVLVNIFYLRWGKSLLIIE